MLIIIIIIITDNNILVSNVALVLIFRPTHSTSLSYKDGKTFCNILNCSSITQTWCSNDSFLIRPSSWRFLNSLFTWLCKNILLCRISRFVLKMFKLTICGFMFISLSITRIYVLSEFKKNKKQRTLYCWKTQTKYWGIYLDSRNEI